jgi:hypothetical protein
MMVRTAGEDRSVSQAVSRSDRPARFWSTTKASTRACTAGSGLGWAVPS